MAGRRILTARQRAAIFDLPSSLPDVLIHHTLSEQGLAIVGRRRGDNNKLGLSWQGRSEALVGLTIWTRY